MLSYKQWKQLNESVFGSFPLGLSQTQSLGISSNVEGAEVEGIELEEGKKKKKVKVIKDGDIVDAAEEKDKPGSPSCGCSKCGKNCKNMLSDDDDADNEEDEDEDKEDADADADAEDEDEDEDEDDEDEEEDEEEDDDEEEDEDDEDEEEDADDEKKAPKMMKKMKKEEREWLGSLLNQIGDPTQKFDSGFSDGNFSADQAGPGEVGYAPSGKIADNFTKIEEALTAKQKATLPKALQDAIAKKQGSKSEKSEDSDEESDKSDKDSDESNDKESDEGSKGSVEKHLKAYLKKNPKASFKEAKDYVKKQKGMEKSKVTLKDYLVCKKKAK